MKTSLLWVGSILMLCALAFGIACMLPVNPEKDYVMCRDKAGTLFPVYNGTNAPIAKGDTIGVGLTAGQMFVMRNPEGQYAQMVVVR